MSWICSIFVLITIFQYNHAWNKSDFHIDSKLSKECGHSKSFSPENYFEHWGFWPWLGMAFYDGFGRGTKCNAVLIHPQAVISSLHCFKKIPDIILEEHLFVAFSLPGLPSFQNISVTHLDFPGTRYNSGYDLALLRLSRPVVVSAQVQPICLWEEDHDYSTQLASHIGMMVGADLNNLYDYDNFNTLRSYQAPVRVINAKKCREKEPNYFDSPNEKPLCYSYYRVPVTCHGFGSMLMFPRLSETGDIVWYLRSIVTLRKWLCDDNSYTSSFDVADRRPWIESHFRTSKEKSCGRQVATHTPLVTLGQQTHRGDWPWHAALFLDSLTNKSKSYRCGGSLISPLYVLTAGHCVMLDSKILDGRLSAKLGKFSLNSNEPDSLDIRVSEVILHEFYDQDTLRNDIALLKLSSNVTYNQYIQPVCLWHSDNLDKKNIFNQIGRRDIFRNEDINSGKKSQVKILTFDF
ncbi:proclotting enzyme-like isoform X2 [Arctopsyche grandis]|uniref:proclotting enzyme-like isoform X2 n=1 Tax=Arctopsyche grandis TaxID=121162 RepID=UPI00406D7D52